MKSYSVFQVDSFTTQLFRGNPAGVVLNADGLTDIQMQSIARELNNSETAFVFSPTAADHDVWVRFFTPGKEVPSCGHATIAAHYVRAREQRLPSCVIRQKIGIGILPVEIISDAGDYTIVMTQGPPEFGPPIEAGIHADILSALGLGPADLDDRCPMEIASTGHSKVLIGIRHRATLNALHPDMTGLAQLSRRVGSNGYFVFTLDSDDPSVLSHGRMFAPAIAVNEDPVTGNANGPLGAYLVRHGLATFSGSRFAFRGMQGEAIGRTGIVEVQVTVERDVPVLVKVGGRAVVAFHTEILL